MNVNAIDAWLAHLFDRPPEDLGRLAWFLRADQPMNEWSSRFAPGDGPRAAAERIGQLLSSAGNLLRTYSDDQVGHGLKVIVDGSCGGEIRALTDRAVPRALRTSGLRSIATLFAEVFAARVRDDDLRPTRPAFLHPGRRCQGSTTIAPPPRPWPSAGRWAVAGP
jgi:hypothetical protein